MRKLFGSCALILLTMSLWNVRSAIAQDNRPVYDRAFFEPSAKVVTPHIAWATKEARERLLKEAAANIKSFLNGKLRNVVNGVRFSNK